jgi:hypothetical protein
MGRPRQFRRVLAIRRNIRGTASLAHIALGGIDLQNHQFTTVGGFSPL